MGMDVSGKMPRNEDGEYFRASVWSWHPLWDYCCEVAPGLTEKVKYGHSNDGDGLDAEHSKALGAILRSELTSGRFDEWLAKDRAELAAMPDEECYLCEGTGKRQDPPNVGKGNFPCNGCGETGKNRPSATSYSFDKEHFEEWVRFLENCGGFAIW